MIPWYQFIWNKRLYTHTALIRFLKNHSNKSIRKKNTLTVKHAFACANLLRLLLRHTYLIRLNQHRVVMIKRFSPISVWERHTISSLPLQGWKRHESLRLSALLPQTESPHPVCLFFSSFLPAILSVCLSSCFSLYQWRHFLSPSWGKYGGLVGGGFQKGKWLPSRGRSREKKAGRLIAPASNSTAGYHPEPGVGGWGGVGG